MTTKGLLVLMLAGYAVSIWIAYEIIKAGVKDALKELKAAEKDAAEKAAETKIQD